MPLYVDSDNALGSPTGDIDDAIAVSALIGAGVEIHYFASVFGNTSERRSRQNLQNLASHLDFDFPVLQGASQKCDWSSDASTALATCPAETRVLALGPLTNIAGAIRKNRNVVENIDEIVLVGSNSISTGRWPPLWPHEFNLVQDRQSTWEVFQTSIPITVIPLNVARTMMVDRKELNQIPAKILEFFRPGLRRWQTRNLILKQRTSFPVWDLVATMYYLVPELFTRERKRVKNHRSGFVEYSEQGLREVQVITSFDSVKVWQEYIEIMKKI